MSRVGETGVGEMGIGETGVGEMGVGETGPNHLDHLYKLSFPLPKGIHDISSKTISSKNHFV